MITPPKFLVVIGASAGGLNALIEMVEHFQKGLDTCYCIVLHLSRKGIGDFIVHRLSQVTSLPCRLAENGTPLKKDHIYIARPNQHMLVKENKFLLGAGPEENRIRPSIDVLFRSAAVAYSSHCIGIILSGLLDDGTSGMWAIKRSGGSCVVQDPNEAEYPDMPLSVINNMEVDEVATLVEIGPLIAALLKKNKGRKKAVPADVKAESKIAERTAAGFEDVMKLDDQQSLYACPDYGGGLWEAKHDIIKRYPLSYRSCIYRKRPGFETSRNRRCNTVGGVTHDGRTQTSFKKDARRVYKKRIQSFIQKQRGKAT